MAKKVIKFVDLTLSYNRFRDFFHEALDRVMSSGIFILGEELKELEKEVIEFTRGHHAIGVGNGTDALILSLRAGGITSGDEVITTPMSYLASTSAITNLGATAVFIDIDSS